MTMSIKTVQEVMRERLNELTDIARGKFRDSVRPVYGVTERSDPVHIGSALLLNLPEGKILLTAAHVLDANKFTSLYIGTNDQFVVLQFNAFVTIPPNGDRSKDHYDFAVAPLDAENVGKFGNAKFITEGEISRSVAPTADRTYTCLGYPNSKNKIKRHEGKKVTPVLLPYSSLGRPSSLLPGIALDDHHILVAFDAKAARDEDGTKIKPPALRGCSGGAIIDLGRISAETLVGDVQPKLAALLIEAYDKEKIILGTRLSAILAGYRTANSA